MQEINGKYNSAKVYTDVLDDNCIEQIQGLLDLEVFKEAQVRIMPDCHAGSSCVIGFTADLGDKVIPNIVGVDMNTNEIISYDLFMSPMATKDAMLTQKSMAFLFVE